MCLMVDLGDLPNGGSGGIDDDDVDVGTASMGQQAWWVWGDW
jgi:hypothetical protein